MAQILPHLCFFVLALFSLRQARATPRQFPNCNNCYAVTAYEIIKYHKPRLM